VSGRGAANLEAHKSGYRYTSELGIMGHASHNVTPSGEFVEVRDVVMRSPVVYNATKLREVGGFREDAEEAGLGDIDVSGISIG
jgi:hypothetical protein